jgi:phosphoglycerate-specific signal transduction histidine kinase
MSEDSPFSRPLVLPGAAQGPAVSAANVAIINEQFNVINQNFKGIDKIFEELRYNVRAVINEDVGKLRDEIRQDFDVKKIREGIRKEFDEIDKEFAAEIASLRLETLKTINESLNGADKTFLELGLNVRKMIDEGADKIRDEVRKEFSVDNLRKEFVNEIASLRADMTIQVASLRADITTRKVQPIHVKGKR